MARETGLPRHGVRDANIRTRARYAVARCRCGKGVVYERIVGEPGYADEGSGEEGEKEAGGDEEGAEWGDGGVVLLWHGGELES